MPPSTGDFEDGDASGLWSNGPKAQPRTKDLDAG
jgi:hypothetical protein